MEDSQHHYLKNCATGSLHSSETPLKTNISPEEYWPEEISFWDCPFFGVIVHFPGGYMAIPNHGLTCDDVP